MDISELLLPTVVVLVVAATVVLFFLAHHIRHRWLRVPIRVVSSIATVLTCMLLALFIFSMWACTYRAPSSPSPDAKHVAVLRWGLQGALGSDIATVLVRSRWSPFGEIAYRGPGFVGSATHPELDPQIHWVDSKHLMIRFHEYADYDQSCVSHAKDIDVICVRLPPLQ
jgi:hypothetical protein